MKLLRIHSNVNFETQDNFRLAQWCSRLANNYIDEAYNLFGGCCCSGDSWFKHPDNRVHLSFTGKFGKIMNDMIFLQDVHILTKMGLMRGLGIGESVNCE